jgi:hypothetical protein
LNLGFGDFQLFLLSLPGFGQAFIHNFFGNGVFVDEGLSFEHGAFVEFGHFLLVDRGIDRIESRRRKTLFLLLKLKRSLPLDQFVELVHIMLELGTKNLFRRVAALLLLLFLLDVRISWDLVSFYFFSGMGRNLLVGLDNESFLVEFLELFKDAEPSAKDFSPSESFLVVGFLFDLVDDFRHVGNVSFGSRWGHTRRLQ